MPLEIILALPSGDALMPTLPQPFAIYLSPSPLLRCKILHRLIQITFPDPAILNTGRGRVFTRRVERYLEAIRVGWRKKIIPMWQHCLTHSQKKKIKAYISPLRPRKFLAENRLPFYREWSRNPQFIFGLFPFLPTLHSFTPSPTLPHSLTSPPWT